MLHNLWDPVQNQSAGPFVFKILRTPRRWQWSIKTSVGDSLSVRPVLLQSYVPMKPALPLKSWGSHRHWLPKWHAASLAWNIIPPPFLFLYGLHACQEITQMWSALGVFHEPSHPRHASVLPTSFCMYLYHSVLWLFVLKSVFLSFLKGLAYGLHFLLSLLLLTLAPHTLPNTWELREWMSWNG